MKKILNEIIIINNLLFKTIQKKEFNCIDCSFYKGCINYSSILCPDIRNKNLISMCVVLKHPKQHLYYVLFKKK